MCEIPALLDVDGSHILAPATRPAPRVHGINSVVSRRRVQVTLQSRVVERRRVDIDVGGLGNRLGICDLNNV